MSDDKMNGAKVEITLPSTNHALLRKIKHAEWLVQFSETIGHQVPGRTVPMTPFRAGAINRLRYAAEYIRLLESELFWLARDNKGLRRQVQHLGGTVPPPFRPEAEAVHGRNETESKDGSSDDGSDGGSGR